LKSTPIGSSAIGPALGHFESLPRPLYNKIILQLKKNRYLKISIILSTISISLSVLINIQIAREYLRSDGKTRALFGLKELLQFEYQYYVCLLGVISLIIAILGIKGNSHRSKISFAILLSLLALLVAFVRIWRLFTW